MYTRRYVPQPTRKRSFQLFELLLSLALLTLCLMPLMATHMKMRKADWYHLEEMQLERLSQHAFCLFKEKLYAYKEYRWEELKRGIHGTLGPSFTVYLGTHSKQYRCEYETKKVAYADKPSCAKEGVVLAVDLYFSPLLSSSTAEPIHFQRTLYIERKRG